MNTLERLLRVVKAHNRHKPKICIECFHQDDISIAKQWERLINFEEVEEK